MKGSYHRIEQSNISFQLVRTFAMLALLGLFCFVDSSQAEEKNGKCRLYNKSLTEKIESATASLGKGFPSRIFQGRSLCDYMNGGAEEYLAAGCTCLWVKEFGRPRQQYMVLEVYEFANGTGAKLIYSKEAGERPVELGDEGSSSNCYLVFRQEKVLCRVLCFNREDTERVTELGKEVAMALAEEGLMNEDDSRSGGNERAMMDEKSDRIVIIGASYAKGLDVDSILGMKVVNKGVAGEQSGEMLARFEEDVVALNPETVIIWGFINDIFRSDRGQMDVTVEQAKRNFEKMVELAREAGIRPILATEVTVRARDSWKEKLAALIGELLGKESYQRYVNKHVIDINEWIKRYAKVNDLMLLDFQAVLSDGEGIRRKEYATSDGSHISKKGYNRLIVYTKKTLQELGAEKD